MARTEQVYSFTENTETQDNSFNKHVQLKFQTKGEKLKNHYWMFSGSVYKKETNNQ